MGDLLILISAKTGTFLKSTGFRQACPQLSFPSTSEFSLSIVLVMVFVRGSPSKSESSSTSATDDTSSFAKSVNTLY